MIENKARVETIQVPFHLAQDEKNHQTATCIKDICLPGKLESTEKPNLLFRSLRKQAERWLVRNLPLEPMKPGEDFATW